VRIVKSLLKKNSMEICRTGDVISQGGSNTEGPIIAVAISGDERYLVTVGENKMLSVWQLPGLGLINERWYFGWLVVLLLLILVSRELPKRPTQVAFTKDAQTILVSDKFGDVFRYAWCLVPFIFFKENSYPFEFVRPEMKAARDEFASHENPSDGQLILGHASPLTSFVLSHDEKYIITADRDEHIRVSWYPEGYNIEMYCLGHRKWVLCLSLDDGLMMQIRFCDTRTSICDGDADLGRGRPEFEDVGLEIWAVHG